MKNGVVLLGLLSFCLLAGACRHQPKAEPPRVTPDPVATATATPASGGDVIVPTPETEFAPKADPADVLSEDITEADRMARERGWIRDAFFAFDASTLDDGAQGALQQSATWLREHDDLRIRVEGHCDERGTEQYNLALGDRRAETAASYLATLGVDRVRIQTQSYGEERPFEEGSDEAALSQNRRAHLVLSGRR